MRSLRAFAKAETGASAAQFVLVAPIMVGLIMMAINAGLMMYSGAALNFAVADAARCGAVKASCNTSGAPDVTKTRTYAEKQYAGFTTSRTFTPATASCGVKVDGAATYKVVLGIASFNLPLEATACYPLQPTV